MQIDEFCAKVFQRWRLPNETAFAEDAKMFLADAQGDTLDRVFRRLVMEWQRKNGAPSIADILDLCKAERPRFSAGDGGSINRRKQFEWVRDRVPQLLSEWKERNIDLARRASANGWGFDLRDILGSAAWLYAQYEWLLDNGFEVMGPNGERIYRLPQFAPREVNRSCFDYPKTRSVNMGNIGEHVADFGGVNE